MRNFFFMAIIFSLAMYSCSQPYIYVEKKISHTKVLTYNVNTSGKIEQQSILFIDDIVKTLTGDIDGYLDKRDYTIKELTIQSVSLDVIRNPDNTATSMNLSSFIINSSASVSPKKPLLTQTNIPTTTNATNLLVNTQLSASGIEEMNKALGDAVKKTYKNIVLIVDITGGSVPTNARISAQVKMNIRFDMQYSYCEQSLFVIDGPTGPCKK